MSDIKTIFLTGPSESDGNYHFFQGKESFLSNFHSSEFEYKDHLFKTVEHFFQYCKAMTFDNPELAKMIVDAPTPFAAKQLGLQVSGFDDKVWVPLSKKAMRRGLWEKFSQNEALMTQLMDPELRTVEFVECSKRDCRWAIGLTIDNELKCNSGYWLGQNWLGDMITELKDLLWSVEPPYAGFPYKVDRLKVTFHGTTKYVAGYLNPLAAEAYNVGKDTQGFTIIRPDRPEDWYGLHHYEKEPAVLVTPMEWQAGKVIEEQS